MTPLKGFWLIQKITIFILLASNRLFMVYVFAIIVSLSIINLYIRGKSNVKDLSYVNLSCIPIADSAIERWRYSDKFLFRKLIYIVIFVLFIVQEKQIWFIWSYESLHMQLNSWNYSSIVFVSIKSSELNLWVYWFEYC